MWFDSEPLQSPILLFSYIPYTISLPLVCTPNIISNKKPLPKSVTSHITLSSCSMTFVITLIKQASIKLIGHLCPSINSVFQKTWDASFLISVMYGSFYIDTEWVDERKKKAHTDSWLLPHPLPLLSPWQQYFLSSSFPSISGHLLCWLGLCQLDTNLGHLGRSMLNKEDAFP